MFRYKKLKDLIVKNLHSFDKKTPRKCISCSTGVFPVVYVDKRPTREQRIVELGSGKTWE